MKWNIVLPVLAAVLSVGFASLVGGPQDVDVNDEGAQNALSFAVNEHNKRSNALFLTRPMEVIRVQRQVVAGLLYTMTVRMGKTPCRKNNASDACAVHDDPEKAQAYQCVFKVWSKPWQNEIKLTEETCS
ncbi:cystatin-like [Xyrichtys novacula]|uniref:Cystatin-like n=1 Tax=Xyrichtys novacula TaxID=13765 RepID=A0AAV1G305_XYRNO|nr:cystatin-like [Xyrichtys novacula]